MDGERTGGDSAPPPTDEQATDDLSSTVTSGMPAHDSGQGAEQVAEGRLSSRSALVSALIGLVVIVVLVVLGITVWPGGDDGGADLPAAVSADPAATGATDDPAAPAPPAELAGGSEVVAHDGLEITYLQLTGPWRAEIDESQAPDPDDPLHQSYDVAAMHGVYVDPDRLAWIAVTRRASYEDSPTGGAERMPDGIPDVLSPEIDDYVWVSISSGADELTTILDDNDAAGGPVGNQAVLAGAVQVVFTSELAMSGDEPVWHNAAATEVGAFTAFIADHPSGGYDFDFTFFNRFTVEAGYPTLWLAIAEVPGES